MRSAAGLALCTVLLFPRAAGAQHTAAPDSQSILRDLRGRQARFERVRRGLLPVTLAGYGSRCEQLIGRICEWRHDDAELIERLGPEDERATAAREEFRAALAEAARTLPGDPWIAGQRVRYAIDAERADEAVVAAAECGAAPWWCAALGAFAAHTAGRYAEADSRYAAVLRQLPDTARCAWTDLTLVLEPGMRRWYRPLSCAERDSANATLWQAGDPLYLVPGNERRTEHYSRFLWHLLVEGTETPYPLRWGDDFREVLVRYGRHDHWGQAAAGSLIPERRVIGLRVRSGEPFLPTGPLLDEGTVLAPAGPHHAELYERELYAPPYAREWRVLDHQLARFRRGSDAVLVAAFRTPAASDAALFFVDPGTPLVAAAATLAPGDTARFTLRVGLPGLVSVEALDRRDSVAYRSRYWLEAPLPAALALSDLLLVEAGDSLPASLDEAAARARPGATYAPGERVHLYWEAYAVDTLAPAQVAITVVQRGRSVLRRAAEWLGLVGPRNPAVRLAWEPGPDAGSRRWPGTVSVTLPHDLRGAVTVRLEIVRSDGLVATASRDVVVAER